MSKLKAFILISASISVNALADTLQVTGKIVATEGHYVPACRIVKLRETTTNTIKTFRIADAQGHDDVNSVALTALITNRDVSIAYDPAVTTGCGGEPKVLYIDIW